MIDTTYLSKALTERFGLEVEAKSQQEERGHIISISPCGIERTISFRVELQLGWRTITAEFIPGNYASGLVAGMRAANQTQRAAFVVFSNSLKAKGAMVVMNIDGIHVDASSPDTWPVNWSSIQISMKKVGVLVEKPTGYDFDAVFPWATGFLGLSIALLPIEELEDPKTAWEYEGLAFYGLSKKYERSRINRAACIETNGTSCKICGFNFGITFGESGKGFIHIHHIIPVSEMHGSYALNPATDLIPVCPNCHAMLHHKQPALTPEELVQIFLENKNRNQTMSG